MRDVARDLGPGVFKSPRVLQSMIICKQPRIGGQGEWSYYLSTGEEPPCSAFSKCWSTASVIGALSLVIVDVEELQVRAHTER